MPNLVNIQLTLEITPTANRQYGGVVNLLTGDFVGHGQTATVSYDNSTYTLLVDLVSAYGYSITKWEFITASSSVQGDSEPVVGIETLASGANATLKLEVAASAPPSPGTPAPPSDYGTSVMSNYSIVPSFSTLSKEGTWRFGYSVPEVVRKRRGTFTLSYSVGIPFIPAANLRFHNIKSGEEVWQLVKAEVGNQHFIGWRLRYFAARGGYLWFLLVSTDEFEPLDTVVKLLRYDYISDVWEVHGEASFGKLEDIAGSATTPPKYPSFGCVVEGHNGIVYANPVGAVYFPYNDNAEPVLIPLFSSSFTARATEWMHIAVLATEEGFLFLPHGILWDFDVFYDFPVDISLSPDDRLIPVYLEDAPAVVVRTKEYPYSPASTIKSFYVWGGMEKGLVKGQVGVDTNLSGEQANPIYLGGVKIGNRWYAINAYPHWDEATILEYRIKKNESNPADMKQWQWTLSHKLKVLPLPFGAPIKEAPHLPPGWGEMWYFSLGANNHYAYFGRMFDRVYRLRVSDKRVSLAVAIPYLDFGGNFLTRFSGVEPAVMMFSLNLSDGRVYVCHLRSGGRIQIWRQSSTVTPPDAPNIVFPPEDNPVPRQFDVIFQPAIDSRPQEFSVSVIVDTGYGRPTYTYYSFIHRSLFHVSTDGGVNYYPMQEPIVVGDDRTFVKFTLPHMLPAGAEVTITVVAYAIE